MVDALDPEPLEYVLMRVADHLQRRFTDVLRPHGLSPRQFSALAVLAHAPQTTAADLARAVLVKPQSVGPLLDQLEEAHLVRRADRRGRGVPAPVTLTEAGRERLEEASRAVLALDAETRRVVGSDHARVVAALRRLEAALIAPAVESWTGA